MEKKQTLRYSDAELSLIKNSFADNSELLYAIRKVFLQLTLTAVEQAMIINLKGKVDLLKVIRKAYLPELDGDAPINQVVDLWMTLEIKDKEPEQVYNLVTAREKLISYLDQQLKLLETGVKGTIKLADCIKIGGKIKANEIYSNLIMRNSLISHSEMQLNTFEVLAGMKSESVEDTKKRLFANSSK